MATVGKRWKRVIAFGCSHGEHLSDHARTAILAMIKAWKPHTTIHLGDFWDTTAWRAGAKGSSDETIDHAPDIDAGLAFIRETQANVVCVGNHENRIYKAARHYNAILRGLAQTTIAALESTVSKNKGTLIYPYSQNQWFEAGGYRWGHGFLFNENYLRDSAEAYGNCVVAHGHRPGLATGRRLETVQAYGVGCLCEPFEMDYASGRKSTLAWGGGFVWGEYCDDEAVLWLHQQPNRGETWRLPI